MGRLAFHVLCVWLAVAGAVAQAAPAAPAFFRPPQFSQVRLSPSGDSIAAFVAVGEERRLWVRHTDGSSSRFLSVPVRVRGFFWATDERLLLRVGAPGQAPGLAAVNRDGSGYRLLIPPPDHAGRREGAVVVDLLGAQPAHVLVAYDRRLPHAPDVYRLNIFTGDKRPVVRNPGRVFDWLTDRAGNVRVALAWRAADGRVTYEVRYRAGRNRPWRTIHRFVPGGEVLLPLAFAGDNETLIVASAIGRNTSGIYRYDPATGTLGESIFVQPGVDVRRLAFGASGEAAVVRFQNERPVQRFLSDASKRRHAWLSRQLPGLEVRIVSRSTDADKAIVYAYGDRVAGRYYLFDSKARSLELVGARRPWLDPEALAPMQPIQFETADGLTLHGYLTLPADDSRDKPPLIVYPHGGPWSRDVWGFDPVVQFLASQGFAVLQVNYRGSTGYGRRLLNAGRGEWGGAILADLRAGVRRLAERGRVDTSRTCILGASFGGYAALMSAARFPAVYDCAVSFAAVTNLPAQIASYRQAGNARAYAEWRYMVGDPGRDHARLVAASPMNHTRAYRVPLLIAHGAEDERVSVTQAKRFAAGLRAAGKAVRLLVFAQAAHGLADPDNRALFYRRAVAFIHEAFE